MLLMYGMVTIENGGAEKDLLKFWVLCNLFYFLSSLGNCLLSMLTPYQQQSMTHIDKYLDFKHHITLYHTN